MPMPTLVADRVNELGCQQAMPITLTFGDRHANEIPDNLDELAADADAHDDELYIDDSSSNHDDDELERFLNDDAIDTNSSTSNSEHNELDQVVHKDTKSGDDSDSDNSKLTHSKPGNSDNDDPTPNITEEIVQNTGVDEESGQNTGVEDDVNLDSNEESGQITGVDKDEPSIMDTSNDNHAEPTGETVYEQFQNAIRMGCKAGLNNNHRRPKQNKQNKQNTKDPASMYANLLVDTIFDNMSPKQAFSLMIEDNTRDMFAFVTEQMSAKQGLQVFGEAGAKAVMKELEQLVYRKVV